MSTKTSMKNKWDYSGMSEACYSDPKEESYKKTADFLGETVEDWGCGTGWSKRYFKNYKGIDGSVSREVAETIDLREYTSDCDNILMRQVLELNEDWRKILKNVKSSFKKKFCLVVFTPSAKKTHVAETEPVIDAKGKKRKGESISLIYFNRKDILRFFPKTKFKVREEIIKTEQGYGEEWIVYVERL